MPIDARTGVNCDRRKENLPGTGYAGVAIVRDTVRPARELLVTAPDGGAPVPLGSLPVQAVNMWHDDRDPDRQEYALGVDWIVTQPSEAAVKEPGLFANRHSACRLSDGHTIAVLVDRFGLDDDASHAVGLTAAAHDWWATLFAPEPEQWGLRGDPYAWRALSAALAGQPKPPGPVELEQALHLTFAQVVGVDLNDPGPETVSVPAFAHGGMSSGMVRLPTWRDSLMPLLIARGTDAL